MAARIVGSGSSPHPRNARFPIPFPFLRAGRTQKKEAEDGDQTHKGGEGAHSLVRPHTNALSPSLRPLLGFSTCRWEGQHPQQGPLVTGDESLWSRKKEGARQEEDIEKSLGKFCIEGVGCDALINQTASCDRVGSLSTDTPCTSVHAMLPTHLFRCGHFTSKLHYACSPIPFFLFCLFFLCALRSQKTFRPKKSAPSGSKGAQLRKQIDATLGSGNLREAVRLPPGEDMNEWLAVNTVDFFNQVNLLYGTLTEFCTPDNCPTMTAGPKYEYRWADGVQIKKPIEVSAPKYVEYLMDWIEVQLDDESIFPQKLGTPFPPNFKEVVKTIFKRLFRVYAHIYHSHFQKILSLKEEAHLNTCFKHFILFTYEFGLVDKKELAPLQELIESIIVPY
ncbi:hypothetical protein Taro_003098 [Colocasia esculenta]|uniref:MOB kinase activator-like 1A n=1 Tax=Colocasia esculenta TaxID=4460 RepID=A0A843TEM4_COLES|nr:hypothetical protein [Colocasia esculenta]